LSFAGPDSDPTRACAAAVLLVAVAGELALPAATGCAEEGREATAAAAAPMSRAEMSRARMEVARILLRIASINDKRPDRFRDPAAGTASARA
jgi:hypothetical protein